MVVAAVKNCLENFYLVLFEKHLDTVPISMFILHLMHPGKRQDDFYLRLLYFIVSILTRDGEGVSRRLLTPRNSWQASQGTFAIKFSREPLSPRDARKTKNLLPGRPIETIES